jgi:site-specific recombinase XerD
MSKPQSPKPLFDSLKYLSAEQDFAGVVPTYCQRELKQATIFLLAYKGSAGTFNSYRRELERLFHWASLVAGKKVVDLKREDIEDFVEFCQKPPAHWVGTSKPPRFVSKAGERVANPNWRPFVATVSKSARRQGLMPKRQQAELSGSSVRELLAILSSFFNFLVQEEMMGQNPVALIRQKSRFLRRHQSTEKIRRLSELQWQYVMKTVQNMADSDPVYERSLFVMSALYGMYLRISELAASNRWTPLMNDFARDGDGHWWFTTVGKGNKSRQIAVSDDMLAALKRWRQYLGLSALPSPADHSPLLPKQKGTGPVTSTNTIRDIVQYGFDQAIDALVQDGLSEEAETLNEATVHWLRHTGISDDVKVRPREHVRDDAGHSSSAITDRYIDIELRERHRSARKKTLLEDDSFDD